MKTLFTARTESTGDQMAEIDEELLFHLRSRIEDNRSVGMSEDEAWEDARRRLGSYRSSVEECSEIRSRSKRRVLVGGLAVVAFFVSFLWIAADSRTRSLVAQQSSISQQLGELTSVVTQTAVAAATLAEDYSRDFVTVVTHKGKPVPDANLLVILKTWPENRYQQEPFHARTDAEGKATLTDFIPSEGKFAIHVAVVHDGHALASDYHLFKAGKPDLKKITPLKITLTDAEPIRFHLKDKDGQPVADAQVAPASRKTKALGKLEEHIAYFDAVGPVSVSSASDGVVTLNCFARGDTVRLFVTPFGGRPTEAECKIPDTGDLVEVTVTSGADDSPGGRPPKGPNTPQR